MSKYYVLKKDLPTFNTGDIFMLKSDGCLYCMQTTKKGHWKQNIVAYNAKTLKAFPEILEDWFEYIYIETLNIKALCNVFDGVIDLINDSIDTILAKFIKPGDKK